MSRSESVVVTALCMVYDNDKILLQDRIKEDWKGVTFPGGHIEKKESFVKGIEREVFEETGLKIKNIRICGVSNFKQKMTKDILCCSLKRMNLKANFVPLKKEKFFWQSVRICLHMKQ